MSNRRRYPFWPLVAGAVAVTAVAQLLGPTRDAKAEYARSTRPPFAPPPWAFGIAWPLNNVLTLWGNWRVLNSEPSNDRSAYLRMQAAMWLLFTGYGFFRFRLRSPMLGALDTFSFTALAIASAVRAHRIDPALLTSYATLIPWLGLASVLSAYQLGDPDALLERCTNI